MEIRPCIGLQGCSGGGGCVMNATNGLEIDFGEDQLQTTTAPKQVVVVGGGPAGVEIACVAALRGHSVTLMEASGQLGGALHLMKAIPGREQVVEAAAWWARQLDNLGVKVQLGVTATAERVLGGQPDVVVVATGATFDRTGATGFVTSPIPGWDRDFVHTPGDVLVDQLAPAGKVLVLEEEVQAAMVAEVLAAGCLGRARQSAARGGPGSHSRKPAGPPVAPPGRPRGPPHA